MKIAIVGTGIAGLTAAYLLHRHHDITVFEQDDRIGGHTATIDVAIDGIDYAIDTGFIVYNDWTYPNFIRLLDTLGVASQATEMSFSVSCGQTGLEYGGSDLNALFAQRRNLLRPRHWRMLVDILRFNREAIRELESGTLDPAMSLGTWLRRGGYGEAFIDHYLIPMGCAIWSASTRDMLDFPLLFFVRFFRNHGLLSVNNRPTWRVLDGGSRSYLQPLVAGFRERVRLATGIAHIRREADGVVLQTDGGEVLRFDQVVLACHSDQALALLADADARERAVLGAMPYRDNDVVLHTDERLLPHNRRAWSSWNYWLREAGQDRAVLTYNMNILQRLQAPVTFCVTLNATDAIDPHTVLGRYRYSHPVFSLASIAAAERWSEINGVNHTWFCGAYWANGFHEDGVNSGIRVARALGAAW